MMISTGQLSNVKNEDRLIELLVGQPFIAPTLTAVDVEDGEVVVDIVESSLYPDVSKTGGIYYVWFLFSRLRR